MIKNNNPKRIVYMYNYKDAIYITRKANGEWFWLHNYHNIIKVLNLKNKSPMIQGFETGRKVKKLLDYCKKSYHRN